jgi:hypothetical protein
LKRKMLVSLLTVIPALLMPLAAQSQIAKEKRQVDTSEPSYKYKVFAGFGYTSLNQVNQSNNGLGGPEVGITRNWGRFFGLTAFGGHYLVTFTRPNPISTTVDMFMAGPELHAPLYGPTSIFVRATIGAVHTGGVQIQPDESLAGGGGIGMDYKLSPHLGLRAFGDDVVSSFTVQPYQPGDSPHRRFNAHAGIGITFEF